RPNPLSCWARSSSLTAVWRPSSDRSPSTPSHCLPPRPDFRGDLLRQCCERLVHRLYERLVAFAGDRLVDRGALQCKLLAVPSDRARGWVEGYLPAGPSIEAKPEDGHRVVKYTSHSAAPGKHRDPLAADPCTQVVGQHLRNAAFQRFGPAVIHRH